jgi:ORF 12 gene product N-terminal
VRLRLGLSVAATTFLAAVGGSGVAPAATTPALKQVDWVLSAVNAPKAPSAAELDPHFSAIFLRAIPSVELVQVFTTVWEERPLHVGAVLAQQGQYEVQVRLDPGRSGKSFQTTVDVASSAGHLITGIQFTAVEAPAPTAAATPTIAVLPTSSLKGGNGEVNGNPSPYYSGTMVNHVQFVTGGTGAVPDGMAAAASDACLQLYATGRSKGLYPYVRIFF